MLVKIDPTLYNSEKYFHILDEILLIFNSKKHQWFIEKADEILNSEWLEPESAGRRNRKRVEDIQKTTVASAYIDKRKKEFMITIILCDLKTMYHYNPENALKLLHDALYIVVENSNSDKIFIETIAKTYSKREIIEAIEKEWIKFDTEGGTGGIPRRIEFHYNKTFKPRLFVFVDSDRENPTDEHHSQNIETKCLDKDVKYHILFKRAIENYIPVEAFEKFEEVFQINSNDIERVKNAYTSLNDAQKDYYHLKTGFKKGGKKQGKLPEAQIALFNNIKSSDNLFKDLSEGFEISRFNPNNLHQLFLKSVVTKQTLQNRCKRNPKELEEILEKILILL